MKNNIVGWTVGVFVTCFIILSIVGNYIKYLDISAKDCNLNYSGCVTGYNCSQVGETVTVKGADVYGLDEDGDGKGCDRYGSSTSGIYLLAIIIAFGVATLFRNQYRKSYIKRKKELDVAEKVREHKEAAKKGLLCPKDDGILKRRHGKYGDFYGCSNYPSCSFTKRLGRED